MTRPPSTQPAPAPIHLRAAGVSVVLGTGGGRLPAVLHWGADLGELTAADLAGALGWPRAAAAAVLEEVGEGRDADGFRIWTRR